MSTKNMNNSQSNISVLLPPIATTQHATPSSSSVDSEPQSEQLISPSKSLHEEDSDIRFPGVEESYRRSLQRTAQSVSLNRFLLFLLSHILPSVDEEQLQTAWEQLLSAATGICNERQDIPLTAADASSISGHCDDDVASLDRHINELQQLLLA
ncbi:hypothetical protein BC629DRAFT_915175 [Irpex lacteus]|nr:hypothetical protein BC629DRAFT_915175 [Irpex lacteus]